MVLFKKVNCYTLFGNDLFSHISMMGNANCRSCCGTQCYVLAVSRDISWGRRGRLGEFRVTSHVAILSPFFARCEDAGVSFYT